ncbi:sulfite exporter TauE/SafE family protein [Salmonella enterica subsp. enterica serovar Chichester]|nr:sulfite exporter TauE/SafE family protein [Salmonella enterica subsp. enterica serovar Chichester]
MTAWMIAALCGCGMATSLLSALFGVGGSILLVPVLHLLFPQCAVQVLAATSLTVVMLSALINVCAFWRQGIRLNSRLLVLWSLGMATGMQAGVYASFLLSDKMLLMLFGSAGTVVSYLYHTAPDTGALPPAMQFGYVNMAIVAVIFLCTLAFQPISMRLRTLLPEWWLQRVFSGVLLMIATLILVTL